MSTYYNPIYSSSNFYRILRDENGEEFRDYLNIDLIKAVKSIKEWQSHVWKEGQKLEHIAHAFHGTTSTWKLIQLYNGIISPFELKPNQLIKIPNLSDLTLALNTVRKQMRIGISDNSPAANTRQNQTAAPVGSRVAI